MMTADGAAREGELVSEDGEAGASPDMEMEGAAVEGGGGGGEAPPPPTLSQVSLSQLGMKDGDAPLALSRAPSTALIAARGPP
jgi:hypothetical protein